MGSHPLTLLDTHVLVWLAAAEPRLGQQARARADEALAADALAVSAISFWEICMLDRKGRIELGQPPQAYRRELLELGLVEMPVTGEVGIAAALLAGFHDDPADRIIAATASLARATLITADQRILDWPGPLIRQDGRL
ncbi:MAG: type II toxin-antitoxin system VapC family toxin [Acidobacteriota bacterium]